MNIVELLVTEALSSKKPTSISYSSCMSSLKSDIYDTTARRITPSSPAIPTNSSHEANYSPSYNKKLGLPYYAPSDTKHHSLSDIQHLKEEWSHVTEKRQENKGLKICDNTAFSKSFLWSYDIPLDKDLMINIYAGVLEVEAFNQANQRSNHELQKILSLQEGVQLVSYILTQDTIKWRLRRNAEYQFGFVRLIQNIFNQPWLDALATLGGILGISFKNMFSIYNVTHTAGRNGFSHATNETIKYIPFVLDGTVRYASQTKLTPILDYSEQIVGAIACYEINSNKTFALPVAVAQGKLSIGKHKASALFFNQAKMDANPTALVILSLDIHVALDLDDYFERQKDVVVVGHYGHDLSHLPWNCFYNRRIILLCPPSIELYAMIDEYRTVLDKANAKEIHIYPFPLDFQGVKQSSDYSNFTPLEAELAAKVLDLTEESSSYILHNICKKAMSYNEFKKWGIASGLLVKENVPSTCISSVPLFSCKPKSEYSPQTYADINLGHILPTKGVTLIYGKKNVGKSYVVLGFIKALTQNHGFGGIKKNPSPQALILMDTETMPSNFASRLRQFDLTESKNLHCIAKLDCGAESEWANFDISSLEHRNMLQTVAESVNARHIVLDNTTSGVKSGGTYTQTLIGDIFAWTPKLHVNDTGFTIIHHALDTPNKGSIHAEVRGSNELIIRSHSILILIGRDEITQGLTPSPLQVQEAAKTPGATIGIYFKTCKLANIIEGTILWGHLPQNASDWTWLAHTDCSGKELENSLLSSPENTSNSLVIEEEVPFTPPINIAVSDVNVETQCNDASSLSIDEKKVLKRLETQEDIKAKDVMQVIDCKHSKALGILNSLIKKGHIQTEGQGKSTKYFLTQ